jgi:hypothetical protein
MFPAWWPAMGYSKLGKLHKVGGQWPEAPMKLSDTLTFEQYDQDRFGFLRFEVNRDQIVGIYTSAIFEETKTPVTKVMDKITIDLKARKVRRRSFWKESCCVH